MSGASTADVARLQRGIGLEQRAQLFVQHLHLAQPGMTAVHLQARIAPDHVGERRARILAVLHGPAAHRRAREQVALQLLQQPGRSTGSGPSYTACS
jgi:hypothetical protein